MSQQLKSSPALVEEMIQYSIIPTPIKKPPVKTDTKNQMVSSGLQISLNLFMHIIIHTHTQTKITHIFQSIEQYYNTLLWCQNDRNQQRKDGIWVYL